jgi:hypothetical protein
MLTVTEPAMMQSVKAVGVDIGKLGEHFRKDFNKKIAIGPKGTKHSTMGEFFKVNCGNICGIGVDATPIGMGFIDLALEGWRVNRKDFYTQFFIFRDLFGKPIQADMGTTLF